MTREMAIKILKRMIKTGIAYDDGYAYEPLTNDEKKACEVAIKALEQEPTTKNDLGVDYISRAQAQTEIEMNASRYTIARERGGMGQVEWSDQLIKVSDAVDIIRDLPSVTPQEPKTGHWNYTDAYPHWVCCDKCKTRFIPNKEWIKAYNIPTNYCPNCGARMSEVVEDG